MIQAASIIPLFSLLGKEGQSVSITTCSRSFLFSQNKQFSSVLGFVTLRDAHAAYLPQAVYDQLPENPCSWGRRKARVLPFPTTFTQIVCILPDASVLQVTAAHQSDCMLSLSWRLLLVIGCLSDASLKEPQRWEQSDVIQRAIWLIHSLSLSPSREVHDCPVQRNISDMSQARARWHC